MLAQLLRKLPAVKDERLLVGIETADDAGVYLFSEDVALIQTVDFFTPIVDDPYLYGQIAAANALSDVYAMGGQPLTALNIICYPTACGDLETMEKILLGGADKVKESGALLVGGHSIEDKEPKYGLSVTGLVHPAKIVTNHGASNGNSLVLTKRLGTGIVSTALKADLAPPEAIEAACQEMVALNRAAAEAMQEAGVSACTDITGFGFLGHALELARASKVHLTIKADAVPLIPQAVNLAESGFVPAGAYANREYVAPFVEFGPNVPRALQDILFDPQTSGGLLIAVSNDRLDLLLEKLEKYGVLSAAVVGTITPGKAGTISVV